MDWTTAGAFALFIAIMTGTPGPGNLLFMAVGAGSGYRVAFPLILASQIGSLCLHLCVAFGLGSLMKQGGLLVTTFKILCLLYMAWLSWRIINLAVTRQGDRKLPAFWEGLLIHPLSPKTWAMSTVAYTSFFAANGQDTFLNAFYLAGGFMTGGFIAHSTWALAGASIPGFLGEGPVLRTITILMAVGMFGATVWSLAL